MSRHVTGKFDADADADFSDEYNLREHLLKKENVFFRALPELPLPMPERKHFFLSEVFPYYISLFLHNICNDNLLKNMVGERLMHSVFTQY